VIWTRFTEDMAVESRPIFSSKNQKCAIFVFAVSGLFLDQSVRDLVHMFFESQ